jgi:uncharacterized protein (TIGR02466 family)
METVNLFSVPIFKFKFDRHNELKQSFVNHLANDELYEKNTRVNTLYFTEPNLHKQELFRPFTEFAHDSITKVFEELNFVPSFNITGMWATKHRKNGFHHRHQHYNSFIAGVYYLDGVNAAGTTFYSPYKQSSIMPAKKVKNVSKIENFYTNKFEEGTLVIFPSWLEHSTLNNSEEHTRTILSFNVMPLGKTNQDPFDRYNYQDISNVDMMDHYD